MTYNFSKKQAVRLGRNRIILVVLLVLVLVLLKLFAFRGSVLNTFGPYAELTSSDELSDLYESGNLNVTAEADVFFDTNYEMTEDGRPEWWFFTFWAGDQMVICRTDLSFTELEYHNYTVRGKLHEFTDVYDDIRGSFVYDVADELEIETSEADELVADYIIYLSDNRLIDQLILGAGAVVLVLLVIYLIMGIRGMLNPESTKSYKKMRKTGADPALMNTQLSAEVAAGRVLYENKQVVVTDDWVGYKAGNFFAIYPKAAIVWIHRHVVRHRTNGIPSGKTHSVMLYTVYRSVINLRAKNEKDANRIQDDLSRCGFGAIFGYTPDIQQYYVNNLEGFVAEARRAILPSVMNTPSAATGQPDNTQAPVQPLPQPPQNSATPVSPNEHEDGGSVNIKDYKGPEF